MSLIHHSADGVSHRLQKWGARPDRIRNIFFGFNDGLIEVLGAVSGLFAAFDSITLILAASITIAAAGALSMGAGAYVALSSEFEARKNAESSRIVTESGHVLGVVHEAPIASSFIVGLSYIFGSFFPIIPVLFGAQNLIASLVLGALAIVAVSFLLARISGMDVGRRIAINFLIIGVTVGVTYAIGIAARQILGITL